MSQLGQLRKPIDAVVVASVIGSLAMLVSDPVAAVNRRAFVTSTTYDGNLAALPVAGATALDKADTICRQHATDGGLPNAGSYRAWLSTTTTDAYCHVQGLAGKKSTGCGGSNLPGAGPWYQANGATAFTDALDELTGGGRVIFRSLLWNEQLELALGERNVWTGTKASGDVAGAGSTCLDWTSSSSAEAGRTGSTLATARRWTDDASTSCDDALALLCLEPGPSTPVAAFWSPAALSFVAKRGLGGNLGSWSDAGGKQGLEAGDEICRRQAAAARLPAPESFVAWLSTADVDAIDRLVVDGPFKRPDGFTVANSRADLTDGSTQVSLHVTAAGDYLSEPASTLSGTKADGTWSGVDCDGWTSSLGTAGVGGPEWARVEDWTARWNTSCTAQAFFQFYCFSNAVTLFWDGFETTAGLDRWSDAAGVP